MKTDQEIFDTVAKHLLAQGERAITENGACAYRGVEGRKCAIGCLIPDEVYDPNMECTSLSIGDLREARESDTKYGALFNVLIASSLWDGRDNSRKAFLADLQALHDMELHCDDTWLIKLQRLARKYNLNYENKS
jgi:hypothetical protein